MLHAIGKKGGGAGKFVWLCFHLNFLVIAQMVKRAFLPHLDFEASQCLAPGLGWVPDWGRKWYPRHQSLGLSDKEMKECLFPFIFRQDSAWPYLPVPRTCWNHVRDSADNRERG